MYNDQIIHINKDSLAKQDEFTERKQEFKVEGHICVNTTIYLHVNTTDLFA